MAGQIFGSGHSMELGGQGFGRTDSTLSVVCLACDASGPLCGWACPSSPCGRSGSAATSSVLSSSIAAAHGLLASPLARHSLLRRGRLVLGAGSSGLLGNGPEAMQLSAVPSAIGCVWLQLPSQASAAPPLLGPTARSTWARGARLVSLAPVSLPCAELVAAPAGTGICSVSM